MKLKKAFVLIMAFGIWLTACNNVINEPPPVPSNSVYIGTIELYAKYYTAVQAKGLPNWDGDIKDDGIGGWWECDPHNSQLNLSRLVPGGELKNETSYEVTITGTSDKPLTNLQFVFTLAGNVSSVPWTDLSDYPEIFLTGTEINVTETLTTFIVPGKTLKENQTVEDVINSRSDVKSLSKHGILAFTNGIPVDLIPDGTTKDDELMATLTNVTVTITEK